MTDGSDGRQESNAGAADPPAGGPEDRRDRPAGPGAEGMGVGGDGEIIAGTPDGPDEDDLPTPPPVDSPAGG